MRVVVTGGAGFIGSALVRYLVLEKEYEVLNLDALTYAGNLASLRDVESRSNYHFVQADICDQVAVGGIFRGFRPNRIMHLAAESHVDRSITGAADFIRQLMAESLLLACLAGAAALPIIIWLAIWGARPNPADAPGVSTVRPASS